MTIDTTTAARRRTALIAAVAIGAAVAANGAIWVIGRAASGPLAVVQDGSEQQVTLANVVAMTVGPLLAGFVAAAVARRLGPPALLTGLAVAGALLAALSFVPFGSIDADGATLATLAPMHVVAGTAFVAGLLRLRADTRGRSAGGDPGRVTSAGTPA